MNTAQSNREALLARIRKLTVMTQANGCTEAEASAAAELLARLMSAHNVAMSELEVRTEAAGCVLDSFTEFGSKVGAWTPCIAAIATLFQVRVWYEQADEDVLGLGFTTRVCHIKFFGFAADVEAALTLTRLCYTSILTEGERWATGKRKSKRDLDSFHKGMANRLHERITSLTQEVPKSGALVVLKRDLVNAEFSKLGIHIGPSRTRNAHDPAAYSAGQSAANRTDLGRSGRLSQTAALTHRDTP